MPKPKSKSPIRLALLAGAALLSIAPQAALAQARPYAIRSQPLADALREWGRSSGHHLLFSEDLVRGRTAPAVSGNLEPEQALNRLLSGSGLHAERGTNGTIMIRMIGQPSPLGEDMAGGAAADSESADGQAVVVTGTRIRGASTPSPTIEVTQEQIRDAGFSDLGQVIRSIPQNFAGGQNPGVALGAGGINNGNASSASALNLRGLGPDATLTLLNGRRLSYNGFIQSIDVSVIPIGALSRIEIVADGASAIYGSDAVGGVANIILRRDFNGLDTSARVAIPTDGGGEEYQLSATGGAAWASGGFIAGYQYTDAEAIFSDQRAYTEYMPDPAFIYPSRRQHSAVISGHQNLPDFVEFRVDALYTRRSAENVFYTLPTSRPFQASESEIFTLAPSMEFTLAGGWSITLGGVYAQDETISTSTTFALTGAVLRESRSCYCNTSYAAEIDAEGPLFRLPGGDLRVAVGAGYRRNDFENVSFTSTSRIAGTQSSRYAFGELFVPLIGSAQQIPAINRLTMTAALRYEDYGSVGDIATPRLGVVYEPTADFSLRGSWGRSFKTPTLLQQFQQPSVLLYPAAVLGASGYPANAAVLYTSGGNRDLKPERAETWSATLSVHPRAVPGLRLDLSYFDVDYRDRVLQPIGTRPRTFIDPAYQSFLTFNPSIALQDQIIALSPTGITNATPAPYNPATVIAAVFNQYTNVARSKVNGIDLAASYSFALSGGTARIDGSASWLDGSQQNIGGQPALETVGIVFNPAGFRARGGFVWEHGGLTLATFVNHIASVIDNIRVPEAETGSFTTLDANIRYRTLEGGSIFSNVELALSVQNLFDQSPPLMTPLAPYIVNYDSTNYSAIGRVVSLSITKHW